MAATINQPKRVGFDNLIKTLRTNKNADPYILLAAERFSKKPQNVTEEDLTNIKTRIMKALYN